MWHQYNLINLVVAFIMVYDLYEIGYIENDCETIKYEKNPTMRVSQLELDYYNSNRYKIYLVKIITALICTVFLLVVEGGDCCYVVFPWLLSPLYLVYNRIRNRWNLPIHAMLMHIRYYAPVLISIQLFSWIDALAFLFVYPLRVMIELSVKGKFGGYQNVFVKQYILHDYLNFQQYRLKYYALSTLVVGTLYLLHITDLAIFSLFAYFLLFTSCSLKFKKYK